MDVVSADNHDHDVPDIVAPDNDDDPNSIENLKKLIVRLEGDFKQVSDLKVLKEHKQYIKEQVKKISYDLQKLKDKVNLSQNQNQNSINNDLHSVQKGLMHLQKQIPSVIRRNKLPSPDNRDDPNSTTTRQTDLLNLSKNQKLLTCPEFKFFEESYQQLDNKEKLCLLCFSVFDEHEIIRKTFMVYLWIGEGFIYRDKLSLEQTEEELGNEVFLKLMKMGFIVRLDEEKKDWPEVKRCKINPLMRAAVITLADRTKFIELDSEGNISPLFPTTSVRAFLFKDKTNWMKNNDHLERIQTLFNINETNLSFEKEWFSRMNNVNVVCLGRCDSLSKLHIETEYTKNFLQGLNKMTHLKFLSFQGISRMMDLPDSISNLKNLMILDLRACHNLETLPDEIENLMSLIILDLSECYLLNQLPKNISLLTNLQVLKGFLVGNWENKETCTLKDLGKLPNLRKLSIYTAESLFPREEDLRTFNGFSALLKLTILWGKDDHEQASGKIEKPDSLCWFKGRKKSTRADCPAELPDKLVKLDLRCCPHLCVLNWVRADRLKKLYIRGGLLRDIGQFELKKEHKWENVETLRLKFLNGLEMEWRVLRELFPRLFYLEKVNCPKLGFFPCDENGVWKKKSS